MGIEREILLFRGSAYEKSNIFDEQVQYNLVKFIYYSLKTLMPECEPKFDIRYKVFCKKYISMNEKVKE